MSDGYAELLRQRDRLLEQNVKLKRRLQVWERTGRRADEQRRELAEAVQYDLGLTVRQAELLLKRLAGGAWSGTLEREFPRLRELLAEARDLARVRRMGRIEVVARRDGQVRYLLLDDAASAMGVGS